MKNIITILIVSFVVLIIAGGSETCQHQSVKAEHTSCDVAFEWTLTNGYQPVLHCKKMNMDAGI